MEINILKLLNNSLLEQYQKQQDILSEQALVSAARTLFSNLTRKHLITKFLPDTTDILRRAGLGEVSNLQQLSSVLMNRKLTAAETEALMSIPVASFRKNIIAAIVTSSPKTIHAKMVAGEFDKVTAYLRKKHNLSEEFLIEINAFFNNPRTYIPKQLKIGVTNPSKPTVSGGGGKVINAISSVGDYLTLLKEAAKKFPVLNRLMGYWSKRPIIGTLIIGAGAGKIWDWMNTTGDEVGFFEKMGYEGGLLGTKGLLFVFTSGAIHDRLKNLERTLYKGGHVDKLINQVKKLITDQDITFLESGKVIIKLDKDYQSQKFFRFIVEYPLNNQPQREYILMDILTLTLQWASTQEYVTKDAKKTQEINTAITGTPTNTAQSTVESLLTSYPKFVNYKVGKQGDYATLTNNAGKTIAIKPDGNKLLYYNITTKTWVELPK